MSQFQIPVPSAVRQRMSIAPTPLYSADGTVIGMSAREASHYEDLRLMKQRTTIRIEEELDDWNRIDMSHRYILGIVCLSNDADLEVILAAARHLGLLDRYEVLRRYKEALDDRYEKNFIEIRLSVGTVELAVSSDIVDGSPRCETVPLMLSLGERRRIWLGLFEAAGYKVQWGGTLNVRRTHI